MKPNCLYLHGFASAFDPESDKIITLSQHYNVIPFSYDSAGLYNDIYEEILNFISENNIKVVVGCSLGGYYAIQISKDVTSIVAVALNPAVNPSDTLRKFVGQEQVNFKTGDAVKVTAVTLKSYPNSIANVDLSTNQQHRVFIYIETGDMVISPTLSNVYFGHRGYSVTMLNGGNHRFTSLDQIIGEINQNVTKINEAYQQPS